MQNMTKIKICGLSRPADIQAANQYKPDYIGFVFASKSRRYVTPRQACELKKLLSPDIAATGVFVNEAKEAVAKISDSQIIDIIQLHGQEDESEIRWLKERTGKPVIKAVSVQSKSDITRWSDSCADYLLLDNGTGGTGRTFDWSLAAGCAKPYFLAGGIHAGNLLSALSLGAFAIDLSGGAETDGKKDPAKIAEIMRIIRSQT